MDEDGRDEEKEGKLSTDRKMIRKNNYQEKKKVFFFFVLQPDLFSYFLGGSWREGGRLEGRDGKREEPGINSGGQQRHCRHYPWCIDCPQRSLSLRGSRVSSGGERGRKRGGRGG